MHGKRQAMHQLSLFVSLQIFLSQLWPLPHRIDLRILSEKELLAQPNVYNQNIAMRYFECVLLFLTASSFGLYALSIE